MQDFQARLVIQVCIAGVVNTQPTVWNVESFGGCRLGTSFGFSGVSDHLVELLLQLGVLDISEFGGPGSSIFQINNEPCGGGLFCSDGFFSSVPLGLVGGAPSTKDLCAPRPALASRIKNVQQPRQYICGFVSYGLSSGGLSR